MEQHEFKGQILFPLKRKNTKTNKLFVVCYLVYQARPSLTLTLYRKVFWKVRGGLHDRLDVTLPTHCHITSTLSTLSSKIMVAKQHPTTVNF